MNGIWWLASYPKSGSTWVRMFLNCAITHFPANINTTYQYVSSDLAEPTYQACSVLPITQIGFREAVYLRPAALVNQLALSQGHDCCLKTHNANLSIDDIPFCPVKLSKGAVYIVRDPRDIVISFAQHMGITIDRAIELMGNSNTLIHRKNKMLFHYLSSWSSHIKSWLSFDNPIPTSCIRYESMLKEPLITFRQILDALGLSDYVNDDVLQYAIEQTQFTVLKKQEEKQGFRELGDKQKVFFNNGTIGNWVDKLTANQLCQIEKDHGEVMTELGYLQKG